MRIGITGASGFIGRELRRTARAEGNELVLYSRSPRGAGSEGECWLAQPPDRPWALPEPEQPLDALVHLAGESVMGWWSAAKRARIRDSRVAFTRDLVDAVAGWRNPPGVLVSGSAVGFYGDAGERELNEDSSGGVGFLAGVCSGWERAAGGAVEKWGARVTLLRTGLVLGRDGGPLRLMAPVFRLGLGGRLGSGRQFMPWIHVQDVARLALRATADAALAGPLNVTAPAPVTNAEFTRQLAATLRRPAFFHVPEMFIRLLGGMGREMLLGSQRALPRKALDAGFAFSHPRLEGALADLLA
jgi:uncharacterized protein (TIGR01777 family)